MFGSKGENTLVIEIPDEGVLEVELSHQINLAEIDLACEEAEDLSPTTFQTPEKSCCKDGEIGSSSSQEKSRKNLRGTS